MAALKPQNTLLALKYWSLRRRGQHLAVRDLARSLDIKHGHYFLLALIAVGGGLVAIAETAMELSSTH